MNDDRVIFYYVNHRASIGVAYFGSCNFRVILRTQVSPDIFRL